MIPAALGRVFHTEMVLPVGAAIDFNSSAYTNASARLKAIGLSDRPADEVIMVTTGGTLQGYTLTRADGTTETVYSFNVLHQQLTEFVSGTGGDATVNFCLRWYRTPGQVVR